MNARLSFSLYIYVSFNLQAHVKGEMCVFSTMRIVPFCFLSFFSIYLLFLSNFGCCFLLACECIYMHTHTYTWSRLAHQNSRSRLFAASPRTCHRSSKNKSSISNMSCCNIINGSHSSSKNIVLISLSIDILHIYIQRI